MVARWERFGVSFMCLGVFLMSVVQAQDNGVDSWLWALHWLGLR